MEISNEAATKAANAYYRYNAAYGPQANPVDGMHAALTAALPFLQGVKVKDLKWVKHPDGSHESAKDAFGGLYLVTEGGWRQMHSRWNDISGLEAAKAAAQADYDARILSAIEIPTTSKMEAVAPSPRAQALEELLSDDMLKDISTEFISWKGENPYKVHRGGYAAWEVEKPALKAALSFAIRALSSQPVADGWLPIETAPKDGTSVEVYDSFVPGKDGFAQVIARHDNEHGWHVAASVVGGIYIKLTNPTHWRPLPSSPGASGEPFPQPRRKDGGEPCPECHLQLGETCDICGATRPTGGSNHGE